MDAKELALESWTLSRPKMVAELKKMGILEESLEKVGGVCVASGCTLFFPGSQAEGLGCRSRNRNVRLPPVLCAT